VTARRLLAHALGVKFMAVPMAGLPAYDAITGMGPAPGAGALSAADVAIQGRPALKNTGSNADLLWPGQGFATRPVEGFTLFAVFRADNPSALDQRVLMTCGDNGMGFGPRSGTLQVINEGLNWYGLGPGLTAGVWYHIVITVNNAMGITSYTLNTATLAKFPSSFDAGAGTAYANGDGKARLPGASQGAIALAGIADGVWNAGLANAFLDDPFALLRPLDSGSSLALLASLPSGRLLRIGMNGGIPSHTGGTN
jgi:hypothetical protein